MQGESTRKVMYNGIEDNGEPVVDKDMRPNQFIRDIQKRTQSVEDEKENFRDQSQGRADGASNHSGSKFHAPHERNAGHGSPGHRAQAFSHEVPQVSSAEKSKKAFIQGLENATQAENVEVMKRLVLEASQRGFDEEFEVEIARQKIVELSIMDN